MVDAPNNEKLNAILDYFVNQWINNPYIRKATWNVK